MGKFTIEKETAKFLKEIKSGKRRMNRIRSFEPDYTRQYAKADHEYVMNSLRRDEEKRREVNREQKI